MAQPLNTVDNWAASNLGVFFPAKSNDTFEDGDLTSQCVTLDKHFLSIFTDVPSPAKARGHAKDYGDTLVTQGYSIKVSNPQQGDIVVWKKDGGIYGHTGIVLSNNGVFECNVGGLGSTSKQVITGYTNGKPVYTTVYSSRIDPLYASWRKGEPTFYRIKDKGVSMDKIDKELFQILFFGVLERNGLSGRSNALNGSSEPSDYIGKDLSASIVKEIFYSKEAKERRDGSENTFATNKNINKRLSERDKLEKENITLKQRIKELESQVGEKYSLAGELFGETYYRKNK